MMETIDQYRNRLNQHSQWLYGKRVTFDFGIDGLILLDGISERVSGEEKVSNLTISLSWSDFVDIYSAKLSIFQAFAEGKIAMTGEIRLCKELEGLSLALQ